MVQVSRRKRADYASSDDIFSNFRKVAAMVNMPGYDVAEDIFTMVCRKVARIANLRGRDPQNESVMDSKLDLAVYAALYYAYAFEGTDG